MEESESGKGTKKEVVYVQPVGGYSYHADEDDEISLVDLWLVLVRRKWIILGVTLLCLVLGVGYAWLQPVQYEYRTGIELARVFNSPISSDLKPNKSGLSGLELLSSREESIDLLELQIIPSLRAERDYRRSGGGPVEVVEGGAEHTLILKTRAEPENSDRVKGLHQQIASALEAKHSPAFKEAIRVYSSPFAQRKEMLERWLDVLEGQLNKSLTGSDKKMIPKA